MTDRRRPPREQAAEPQRVQKVLADAGYGSRREIEGWIRDGRVQVNGRLAKLGDRAGDTDRIRVDGRDFKRRPGHQSQFRVIAYNKREGEVVTRHDPEGRPIVFRSLPKVESGRWIAVGRLDINTSGLLLFTNNGELANRLMHPSREVEREYAVRILGPVAAETFDRLVNGIELDDGLARFEEIVESGGSGVNQWFHVLLREGRNREVRRLWEAAGCTVNRLKRVRFGNVMLEDRLRVGQWRELSDQEMRDLMALAGLEMPAKPRPKTTGPWGGRRGVLAAALARERATNAEAEIGRACGRRWDLDCPLLRARGFYKLRSRVFSVIQCLPGSKMTTVRTRFAPSPTGYLHLGGARTALFSYLFARKHGGQFVLRIEDTDLERSTAESVNAILEGMTWLGLEYDEGPFYQTKRFERYNAVIDELMDKGLAYRCTCPKERLDALRDEQMTKKIKPRYDGHCRDKVVDPNEPHVIRFCNPLDGNVVVDDLTRGRMVFSNTELDDLIIRRTDGSPTYNLTVVVDDADMEITHVIRGDDHINNTPRQINILRALGKEPPYYAHVPMILGDDGARLSKRHGAVSVMDYRDRGYLPEALLNYLVRLGWSHGDQEVFSVDEMIQLFDIDQVNKAASAFNTDKLNWLNQQYIKAADPARIAHLLSPQMGKLGIDPSQGAELTEVVKVQADRAQTLTEMAEISAFFYQDFDAYDETAAKKHLRPVAKEPLQRVFAALEMLATDDWVPERLELVVERVAHEMDLKMGKVAQPLRVAVVGRAASPGIDQTLYLVGKDAVLRRIDVALDFIAQREAPRSNLPFSEAI